MQVVSELPISNRRRIVVYLNKPMQDTTIGDTLIIAAASALITSIVYTSWSGWVGIGQSLFRRK